MFHWMNSTRSLVSYLHFLVLFFSTFPLNQYPFLILSTNTFLQCFNAFFHLVPPSLNSLNLLFILILLLLIFFLTPIPFIIFDKLTFLYLVPLTTPLFFLSPFFCLIICYYHYFYLKYTYKYYSKYFK